MDDARQKAENELMGFINKLYPKLTDGQVKKWLQARSDSEVNNYLKQASALKVFAKN